MKSQQTTRRLVTSAMLIAVASVLALVSEFIPFLQLRFGGVQLGGLGKRKLVGDLEERVDIGIDRGNARKRSLGDLTCRELLVGQTGLDLTDAHGCEIIPNCH